MTDTSSPTPWSSAPWPGSWADPSASLHVPDDWAEAAGRIVQSGVRRVMVIGAVDVGKSALCRFLFTTAIRSGRSAALLDTDLGQKTVGPPACVTLVDSQGMRLAFAGTTDPVAGEERLIEGARRLVQDAQADLVIVNTSGLLAGPGLKLKADKIAALQPDLLVALGDETEAVLRRHAGTAALRVPPSPEARRKTKGERRAARRNAFRDYFAGAAVVSLDDRHRAILKRDAPCPPGLLLGLSDDQGNDLGLGLLAACTDDGPVTVLTPIPAEAIARITPGDLRLTDTFSDVRAEASGSPAEALSLPSRQPSCLSNPHP
ncbi:Clp1/GlmU family protein [Microvirga roseola]|uniref:Clp1/GlmU family protein n=1 Tax=Microvirga roseola TaxID=2883126 RepID=UPI001E2ABAC8|nr:Clp1/GlmU family protein [Microvirga roseola]